MVAAAGQTLADKADEGGKRCLPPATTPQSGPYPDYRVAADVLAKMGVPSDFEADKPLRYTHRCDGGTDLYFIANGGPAAVEANCTFRVSGSRTGVSNRSPARFVWPRPSRSEAAQKTCP